MTLIIGFRCEQGVALVSDTKVIDTESGRAEYKKKILVPINAPSIAGAAGDSDLFREFNRKIVEVVPIRMRENTIKNMRKNSIGYLKIFCRF